MAGQTVTVVYPNGVPTFATPAHAPGPVDITVTTVWGTSTLVGGYRYVPAGTPVLTAVTPNTGPTVGTTVVQITGSDLDKVTGLRFGANLATGWKEIDAQHYQARVPAGAVGTVAVTASSAAGDSPALPADTYTYTPQTPPSVSSVWPSNGPVTGNTVVQLLGSGFVGATSVRFGTAEAIGFTVLSDGEISVVAPPAASPNDTVVNVFVTTPLGTSPKTLGGDYFTYNGVPIVTMITPPGGPVTGGSEVTIKGYRFSTLTTVTFGTVAATSVTHVDASTIVAVTPAHAAGAVAVVVHGPNGTNVPSAAATFTYGVPIVTSVTPTRGPIAGGQTIVISGSGFTGATAVRFGATTSATSFVVDSDTQITVVVPPRATAALVNIWVDTPLGTNVNRPSSWFTYQ
jgi:hypothetical protein